MLARPDMPSPSASSGSANPRMRSSGTASSSPLPTVAGAMRGEIITSGRSGAKGWVCYRVSGLPQGVRSPVRVLTKNLFIADADTAFGKHAEDGAVLQLSAIDWLVNRAVRPWDAEPQQKARLRVVVVLRRFCPAVVAVAGGTGERVERWAEAVARSRGSGSDDPVLIEETVPTSKVRRSSLERLRADSSNALLPLLTAVVSPPSISSNRSSVSVSRPCAHAASEMVSSAAADHLAA